LTSFATFALLYDRRVPRLGEQWSYPLFTSAVLLLIILITWIGITRMLLLRRLGFHLALV
jgi:hypothetical protein